MTTTLLGLAGDLAKGRTTSRSIVEDCLERIRNPDGEGARAFLKVDREAASGLEPSPFAGIPISVKDLFDLKGEVTTAGSRILRDHGEPAVADAPAIARLRGAGFVVVGRTNMTEFAFSGLGLNPHYGTPANPYDRGNRRIPGGSSSGAAVSVADGMAAAGIGTDTGGSCRIPAALCGLVGYKPTASAVPRAGAVPLSTTLDSVGPLANSVACCEILHQVMSGEPMEPAHAVDLKGLRIAVPQTLVMDGLDGKVARDFERSLSKLSAHGASIVEVGFEWLSEIGLINAKGGFPAAEGYAWHRALLALDEDAYDPRVRTRILKGRAQDAADYISLCVERQAFVLRSKAEIEAYDVLAMPTVPTIAPTIAELDSDDEAFTRVNLAMLRNPTTTNMMDGCAISLPMNAIGAAPTGLMLVAAGGTDRRLFAIAKATEKALGGH